MLDISITIVLSVELSVYYYFYIVLTIIITEFLRELRKGKVLFNGKFNTFKKWLYGIGQVKTTCVT